MRYACAMPPLPDAVAKAALRSRRRWLAKRRCLRALRTTIAFMVLITPFLYFGSILCCRMPFGIGSLLPNWILLYECWMFLRNAYILARYVWRTPLWAALPIILNLYFVFYYPPGSPGRINEKFYFELFKQERMQIIEMIENQTLKSETCILHLPQPYTHLALQNGLIAYMMKGKKASVLFAIGSNFFTQDFALCYVPDNNPAHWLRQRKIHSTEKIEDNWYIITPKFGYIRAIMNWPTK